MAKTNPALVALVQDLKKRSWAAEAPIWRDIAKRLEAPARSWSEVNVGTLERTLADGEAAVVAGKLLAAGSLSKRVSVAAFRFSSAAREKVVNAGGRCLSLAELATENPAGTKVRILG